MPGSQQDGFSLIEVIVALGILSTAALSLSTLARGSIAGVKQLESRYLARTIADAQLVDVFVQAAPLRIGISDGDAVQMGQHFTWQRTIAPTDQAGLFLIDVQVSEADTGTVMAQISTLRRGP